MTENMLLFLSTFLLLTLFGGMLRVVLGPTPADRMLAAQLMGTAGVGILLLLSRALGRPELVDVGLVFSLLATVTTVAFSQRTPDTQGREASRHDRS